MGRRFNVLLARGVGIPRQESYVELGLHAEAIVLRVYTCIYIWLIRPQCLRLIIHTKSPGRSS